MEIFVQRQGQGKKGLGFLQEMHRTWPFLQAMLSNMDMVLGENRYGIASRYAELVTDTELREKIFGRIQAEWDCSVKWLFAVTGRTELLQDNPTLARSIRTARLISIRSTICK